MTYDSGPNVGRCAVCHTIYIVDEPCPLCSERAKMEKCDECSYMIWGDSKEPILPYPVSENLAWEEINRNMDEYYAECEICGYTLNA